MKLTAKVILGALGVVALGAFFLGRGTASEEALRPTPAPPILERVQALGELHTARYTYQNVFEHATARKAAQWAAWMPGASSLVRNATRNTALVEVHGEVEAGVDLSHARLDHPVGQAPRLILPHATVYRPQVDTKLHTVRPGAFWRDDEIALDAERDARSRLQQAALQQGIIAEAERNAIAQVTRVVPVQVTVQFQ